MPGTKRAARRPLGSNDINKFRTAWEKELAKTANAANNAGQHGPSNLMKPPSSKTTVGGKTPAVTATSRQAYSSIFDSSQKSPVAWSAQPSLAPEDVAIPEPHVARRFVVALDYGTTFTSVSYSIHPLDEAHLSTFPWEVKTITHWAGTAMLRSRKQVPTESWHPLIPIKRPTEVNLDESDISFDDDETMSDSSTLTPDIDYADRSIIDGDQPTEYLWGYGVGDKEFNTYTSQSRLGLVKRAKSQLLVDALSEQDRATLSPILNELIHRKVIRKFGKKGVTDARDVQDVISDFLTEVFAHTKNQLTMLNGFSDQCEVQFVMTVPTIWPPQSSRVLQTAMGAALKATRFGKLNDGSIDNLFIISEPEAAAAFVLAKSKSIVAGETFIILDAGGGTVDACTYTVDLTYPLRLKTEEVPPGGDNCGASYLNENFRRLLEYRLKDETYLFQNGETLDSIVNRLIPRFEDDYKRTVDVNGVNGPSGGQMIYISGLRGDRERGLSGSQAKRFETSTLLMHKQDYEVVFQPLLDRVTAVLANQLTLAFEKDKKVRRVFLVGGFGESPSLRSHLTNYLEEVSRKLPYQIKLIEDDQTSVIAVSAGAVLRAHNLENGPDRIMQSSYGFLRTEPYEPSVWDGHKVANPRLDKVDGEEYVQTVVYFLIKGRKVPSTCTVKPIKAYHTFETTRNRFLCEEVLYVSDSATQSHFPRTDPRNRDVQVAGKILVDMTFLRDRGLIKPILPPSGTGKKYYKVEYELVAIVEGRNLRYEARYLAANGEIQKTTQVSIAAAFRPGTG